jgi:hypothetical protein
MRHQDILLELVELCQETIAEVRQQLVYYRASVYKQETSVNLNTKIDHLRLLASFFADDQIDEVLRDYEAMAANPIAYYVPGECSLAQRVTSLLQGLERQLAGAAMKQQQITQDLSQTLKRHRSQLLALCKHGSRQYNLFQNL